MNNTQKATHEPLIHITKRDFLPLKKAIAIRAIAVLAAFIISGVLVMILADANPIKIYATFFEGAFGSPRKITNLLHETAILLCIALALTPAFKMKFWNCGGEGQVLIGGLATATCMYYLGGKLPSPIYILLLLVVSVTAGALWALIPALFKAKWNTNETLFTLMMNYIAMSLISIMLNLWNPTNSVLAPMYDFGLPKLFGQRYWLNIVLVAIVTALIYIYLKYSKHGYEISVVGESENTAKYVGINVSTVIIRTVAISGALCGLAGLLLVGGADYTITTNTAGGQGFTAIMVSWIAKFNPLYMILTSFLVIFMDKGTSQVAEKFYLDTSIADIITAIMLIFIIACEFFINYKVHFKQLKKHEEVSEK